jgi:hypothetical protein
MTTTQLIAMQSFWTNVNYDLLIKILKLKNQ